MNAILIVVYQLGIGQPQIIDVTKYPTLEACEKSDQAEFQRQYGPTENPHLFVVWRCVQI